VRSIRPLQREDIAQVASLFGFVRTGSWRPRPQLAAYFERVFLDHPWADPEIPSLVYETEAGGIAGFIGSHVRRLRFDGDRIRAGYSSHLFSHPDVRARGAGALLLRQYLNGPQDVTITDGGNLVVRRMWEQLGGHTALLSSLSWTQLFRPARLLGDRCLLRLGRSGWAPLARPLWALVDGLAARQRWVPLRVADPRTQATDLTPRAVVDHLPSVADRLRLYPDYDERFLEWLFDELRAVRDRGQLIAQLVSDQGGRVLGWYVMYLQAGDVSQVMQVAAAERDVDAVLAHLLHDAWRRGAASLQGRLEPRLFEPLVRQRCQIRGASRVLVHARDPQITAAIVLGEAMLTRMDGEWWTGGAGPGPGRTAGPDAVGGGWSRWGAATTAWAPDIAPPGRQRTGIPGQQGQDHGRGDGTQQDDGRTGGG
jgi:hypothetical protein